MMIGQISSEAERASEKTAEAAEEMNSVVTSSAEINKKIADSAKEAADSIRQIYKKERRAYVLRFCCSGYSATGI